MNYNSVYFLHIQKTGGRYITDALIDDLRDNLNPKVTFINKLDSYSGTNHNGWVPDINDDTYIISSFREPTRRFISHYVHSNKDMPELINKKSMFEFLERDVTMHDFQSKNFFFNLKGPGDFLSMHKQDNDIYSLPNFNKIKSRISRVNLLLKIEDVNDDRLERIHYKISKDLNLNYSYSRRYASKYKEKDSEIFFSSLSSFELNEIKKYFNLDYYFYNNTNFFTIY